MEGLVISEAVRDLIINIINIIVLFIIVRTLAYKPVKKFLDARKERIDSEKREADKALCEAEKKSSEYDVLIKNSKAESAELIRKAEAEAKKNAAEIIETAEKNAADITAKARKAAEDERKAVIAGMSNEIADMAIDISERILSREVNEDDNRKIVDAFFESKTADC